MSLLGRLSILLLFVALAGGFWVHRVYWDPPEGPTSFGYQDGLLHALPTASFLHAELQRGNLPLWNPYQMAGQPFLALYVTAALYPPNLLFMGLLPPLRALEALSLLHLSVAGYFAWLLGARLGLSPPARLVAAVAYMFSPIVLHGIYMVPCLATQSWLPAIIWALDGLLAEARPRWAVALAVCFTLSFLGGYAVGIYYALLLALAYGLFGLVVIARKGTRLRVSGLAVLSAVLALGLAAPQMLPTLELTASSLRTFQSFPYEQGWLGSFKLQELLTGLLGAAPVGAMYRSVSLPALTLPLALCGALARGQRARWAFVFCAAGIAGAYMLGPRSPVYAVFYALPLGGAFRSPWQMAFVYQFLAALLVGFGIEGIRRRVGTTRVGRTGGAVVAVGLALLFVVGVYVRTRLPVPPPAAAVPHPGGATGFIEFLRAAPHRGRAFVQGSDLEGRSLLKVGMVHGIFVVPDYESNMPSVYRDFLADTPSYLWQGNLLLLGKRGSTAPPPRIRALDLMSVRYYVTALPSAPVDDALGRLATKLDGHRDGYELFERREALPRAYTVGRVLHAEDFDGALARVLDGSFRPREEAVVTGSRGLEELVAGEAGHGRDVGSAEILRYSTEEVEIAADCAQPCLLVLTDLDYPGWQARVDGREVDVHRTNALFRGVHLAPGSRRVTFRYRPASFRNGVLLLLAAVLVGSIGLATLHARARAPASGSRRAR